MSFLFALIAFYKLSILDQIDWRICVDRQLDKMHGVTIPASLPQNHPSIWRLHQHILAFFKSFVTHKNTWIFGFIIAAISSFPLIFIHPRRWWLHFLPIASMLYFIALPYNEFHHCDRKGLGFSIFLVPLTYWVLGFILILASRVGVGIRDKTRHSK